MIRRITGTAVTTVLVVAAVALAAWFVFAGSAGATLIVFRTGSMAPSMPQGAVAATLPVQASELEVGDVITVQRAGESVPVTHRIIEIGPLQERPENAADIRAAAPDTGPPDLTSPHARQISMQGDDNSTPDHLPYALTDARKVIFSVPYLGAVLMLVQSPLGMGLVILGVGGLVTWAFWPRPPAPRTPHTESTARHAAR